MKKLITIVLILALILPGIAMADLPDISNLSSEELIELSKQIQIRLFSENLINGVTVPAGRYIVGEDIPAGTYRMEVVYKDSGGYVYFYESEDKKISFKESFLGEYWGVEEIGKMVLQDGNVIDISNNALRFYPYAGLFN